MALSAAPAALRLRALAMRPAPATSSLVRGGAGRAAIALPGVNEHAGAPADVCLSSLSSRTGGLVDVWVRS
jgi:hypothetical protein